MGRTKKGQSRQKTSDRTNKMMTLTTILAATLIAPAAPQESHCLAGMAMLPKLVGSWSGKLSYLDYSSGTIESLKAAATIRLTNHGHAIAAEITYPDYGKNRVDSTVFGYSPKTKQWGFEDFPGTITESEFFPGRSSDGGTLVMTGKVTEQVGKEMREVPCRITLSLKGNEFSLLRETGSPLVMRHKFAFSREVEAKTR